MNRLPAAFVIAVLFLRTACAQTITVNVAPFDSSATGNPEIGKKVSTILNLQIWQTLRIPQSGKGRASKGEVTWDVTSKPPASYAEALSLAGEVAEDRHIVLWGRAWQYGGGDIVEAFLSLGRGQNAGGTESDLWKIATPDGTVFSVDVPGRQIDFAPIVLRADLLPGLNDPGGLQLFAGPTGGDAKGRVGGSFRALEQRSEAAKVVLPNGTKGWIRLPRLSREHSEVVDFVGGVVRVFRQDWDGAAKLLQRVVDNANAPTSIRIESYLYLAFAADQSGHDSLQWIRKAYDLNPYSKKTLQYLCMSHLAVYTRMPSPIRAGGGGAQRLEALANIININRALYSRDDPWFHSLRFFIESRLEGKPKG
jgi:hypothetical protein